MDMYEILDKIHNTLVNIIVIFVKVIIFIYDIIPAWEDYVEPCSCCPEGIHKNEDGFGTYSNPSTGSPMTRGSVDSSGTPYGGSRHY